MILFKNLGDPVEKIQSLWFLMDPEYVVLDASSDEDVGLDEKVVFDDSGEDDCDWIQELLKEVDRQTSTEDSDESDDVVLVSEVVVSPKSKLKNSDTGLKDLNDEEDDDDCVVLDGDPDKPEAVENNQLVDESDELQVVAETGQVLDYRKLTINCDICVCVVVLV